MKIKKAWPLIALYAVSACAPKEGPTVLTSGIAPNNLNTEVAPGSDFYEYACGGWMKAHPLTAEYSRYGSFEELYENNNKQLRELIENLAAGEQKAGTLEQKIGTLYNCVIDSTLQNERGWTPIAGRLESIRQAGSKPELFACVTDLYKAGVPTMFGFYIGADIKNSNMNLLQLGQAGLSLGEREYYTDTDTATVRIREAYKTYVSDMLARCGYDAEGLADRMRDDVLRIETRLAKQSRNATARRDPEANYNKMTYEALKADYPGIDWETFFGRLGVNGLKEVSVGQPEFLHEVEQVWKEESLDALKAYAAWKLVDEAASCLDDSLRDRQFAFYGTVMSGKEQNRPRWKRAVSAVETVLGEAVGRLYVEKHFPAAAKERMQKLVKNLQTALGERIQAQEWMSEETKKVAQDKLDAFYVKVGYPDKWKDYTALEITDNYWENMERFSAFELADMIARKLNQPVDRDEWYMTPQTVNAYYNPTTNEICFPAGILQPPFFDMNSDDAFNYGAIGVVIGHEMTHGFDDKGRQFDKNGNLTDWWAPGDAERFKERAQVMADFFSQINVLPDLKANGQLTLGENLADHGGLTVSFQAFQNAMKEAPLEDADGFTPEQRFFLAYANVWAGNIRDEEIRKRTKSDPHALGRWRVNGALPHIDAWYEAFGITENDSLFVPKEQRVTIW